MVDLHASAEILADRSALSGSVGGTRLDVDIHGNELTNPPRVRPFAQAEVKLQAIEFGRTIQYILTGFARHRKVYCHRDAPVFDRQGAQCFVTSVAPAPEAARLVANFRMIHGVEPFPVPQYRITVVFECFDRCNNDIDVDQAVVKARIVEVQVATPLLLFAVYPGAGLGCR